MLNNTDTNEIILICQEVEMINIDRFHLYLVDLGFFKKEMSDLSAEIFTSCNDALNEVKEVFFKYNNSSISDKDFIFFAKNCFTICKK